MTEPIDIAFPKRASIFENLIINALFQQIGADTFESRTRFLQRLTNSEIPSPSACFPTTKAGWRELATLATEGPMETELYYRWAAAINQAKLVGEDERVFVASEVEKILDLADDWNAGRMMAAVAASRS